MRGRNRSCPGRPASNRNSVKISDAAVKPSIAPYRSSTGRSTCVMNFAGSLCWGGPSR